MSEALPNDAVGETIPLETGVLDADLKIHSYEHEWVTVTYKPNRVHVRASTRTSNRTEGIIGGVEFTLTEGAWRELCESVRGDDDD